MHPLVIPYALIAMMLLFGIAGRSGLNHAVVRVAAWLALLVVLWGVVFRTVGGDTARYYASFVEIRELSFSDMLVARSDNILFQSFIWLVGQIGIDVRFLTASVVLFVISMLVYALRRILTPYETAMMLFIYSAYPYLILYVASGLKTAIALAFLLVAFALLYKGRRIAWVWLLIAPFWHSGAWLVIPFLALHLTVFNQRFGYRRGLIVVLAALSAATALSITGLNATLMSPLQNMLDLSARYDIYFMDAEQFDYDAGFRWDFTLFSLTPIFTLLYLKAAGSSLPMPKTAPVASSRHPTVDQPLWDSSAPRSGRPNTPFNPSMLEPARPALWRDDAAADDGHHAASALRPLSAGVSATSLGTTALHGPDDLAADGGASLPGSFWWLSLYLSLNIIYQLFAFAPFADRFAAFSWFIMPIVIFLQFQEARSSQLISQLIFGFVLANILLLQFYTGNWIRLD